MTCAKSPTPPILPLIHHTPPSLPQLNDNPEMNRRVQNISKTFQARAAEGEEGPGPGYSPRMAKKVASLDEALAARRGLNSTANDKGELIDEEGVPKYKVSFTATATATATHEHHAPTI